MKFIQPSWDAPSAIKAYTTVRTSWCPTYPLNINDKQNLKNLLSLPNEPIWINQTHSAIVLEAKPGNREKIADATFTSQLNQICVVVTADCMPILICHQKGTHVAAIHAGWRGLANDIITHTIQALNQPAEELLVWLGPTIGPEKFEVGPDVYEAFTQHHSESTKAFVPQANQKWLADLYQLARMRLEAFGISKIYGGHYCTFSQSDLFFSYRRDKGRTGSMATLIWIDGEKL